MNDRDPDEQAAAADDPLVQRLRAAYDPVLQEPVPERLLAAARGAPAAAKGSAEVVDLLARREARSRRRWTAWQPWMGLAASLALGVAIGRLWAPGGPGPMALPNEVAQALESQPAAAEGRRVAIGLTFVDRQGRYCRTYGEGSAAGLACREDGQWRLQVLARSQPRPVGDHQGDYRQAASDLPRSILGAVDERAAAAPLDAAEEQKALSRHWSR